MSIFRKKESPVIDQPDTEDQAPLDIKPPTVKPSKTLIGPLTALKANITGSGNIIIAGSFSGILKITGDLDILEQADIEGEIEATNIIVKGKIQGKISAVEKVELLKTAHIKADIKSKLISVETGAALNGKCHTG